MDFLPEYTPTEALLLAEEKSFCRESLEKFAPILLNLSLQKTKLTSDNYVDIFQALLSIEDVVQMAEYAKMVKINMQVKPYIHEKKPEKTAKNETNMNELVLVTRDGLQKPEKKPKKFCLKMPENGRLLTADIDEILFIDREGFPKSPLPNRKIMALFAKGYVETICALTRDLIIFPWTNDKLITYEELPEKHFDIIYRSPRIAFRLMYLTLEQFKKNVELQNYLFPIPDAQTKQHKPHEPKPLGELKLFNEFIGQNEEQLQAVQQIMAGPNPRAPYIVFGPPGKTAVLPLPGKSFKCI